MASSDPAAAVPSLVFCAAFLTLLLAFPSDAISSLASTVTLIANEYLSNGIYKATVEPHYNFVLYSNEVPTWTSNPKSKEADIWCHIIMQEDGNLVLYSGKGKQLWESKTYIHGSRLDLDYDGTLHIRNPEGDSFWTPLGQ